MPDLFAFNPRIFLIKKKFTFKVYKGIYKTKITMKCTPELINTSQLPRTFDTLQEHLPTVFKTKCFNKMNYPFSTEVKQTEIAHLFEHIMLEYICQAKIARGERNVAVSGVTIWNWRKDPFGTFHITLKLGRESSDSFNFAFDKSINLLNVLTVLPIEKQTD